MTTAKAKVEETQSKAAQTQEKAKETYHAAEELTLETVDNLKKQAQEKLNEGSEVVKSAGDKAENMIKERPLLSIGCAFLAGWAVSKLLK